LRAKNETSERKWIDGNDATFSRLEADETDPLIPKTAYDRLGSGERNREETDCTAMVKLYGRNESSVWIRASCQNQYSFICKRPAMGYIFEFSTEEKTFKAA